MISTISKILDLYRISNAYKKVPTDGLIAWLLVVVSSKLPEYLQM